MSTYFYEILLGKQTKKYTENPMTPKVPDEPIDDTYIVVKNVVDKLSELIIQPYDYVKKYIIKKNENENDFEEEISVVTISYDTIYKEDQTEQTEPNEDNIDAFVKTATTAYTFVVSTYNDVVT
jgi:hypothetical protein